MKTRRMMAVGVLGSLVLSGCEVARVGTRCMPGQGPGRNDTHVLVCEKGRWKQTITIGEAAEIITRNWPAKVTGIVQGSSGGKAAITLSVTNRAGAPVANEEIRLVAPGLFVGTDSVTLTSNANGQATTGGGTLGTFTGPVLGAPGTYTAHAYWKGADPIGTISVTIEGGYPARAVVVSGDNQVVGSTQPFAPFVFKVVDEHGHIADRRHYEPTITSTGMNIIPALVAQPNGTYVVDASSSTLVGDATVTFIVQTRGGSTAVTARATRTP